MAGATFRFADGERIHTENSHKYSVAEFQALAASAGWQPARVWTDADQLFSLHLLRLAVVPRPQTGRGLPGTPMPHSSSARFQPPLIAAAS